MQLILPIFAILTVLGAWSGWRRSPLYSTGITVKLVGAFVLIPAVLWLLFGPILNGTLVHSALAQGIVGFVAILVVSTGAMVLIVRITDSHVAQLPPSVRVVTLHRQRIQRWIWRMAVYLIVNAAAALLVPASWQWLPLFLGGFLLLLCGPMLAILYMMARRNDRGLSAIIATPWVHWQYTAAQWHTWADSQLAWEQAKAGKTDGWRMVAFVLLCMGLFGVGAWWSGGSFQERFTAFAICVGMLTLFVAGLYGFTRGAGQRRYQRILAASPETYFGSEGFFCNGEYLPWTLSGRYLVKVSAVSLAPAHLLLVFQSFNGSSSIQIEKRVPIPDGGKSDLPRLQAELRTACRTASVSLA